MPWIQEVSQDSLCRLHRAHMLTVPFENLDIPLGREIIMDEDRFLDKIVRQHRGGFCYELNGAFAWLLRQIGFEVEYLSARVVGPAGEPGAEFDHMALLVEVSGERLIADVGFGDSFCSPLRLVADEVQRDSDPRAIDYRLTEENGTWTMWKMRVPDSVHSAPGEWVRQYLFRLEPRRLDQYTEMCRHQQTSPVSTFTRKIVCSRATTEGRVTLTATTLIESTADERVETPVDRERWHDVLRDRFDVLLPEQITRWP